MARVRQLSTLQVALYAALAVTAAVGLLLWALVYFVNADVAAWEWVGAIAGLFALSYAIIHFWIDRFVHNRIKVLYRTVHDLRRGRTTSRGDELDRADEEVSDWANERKTEIRDLQEREKFRREFIGNLAHELKTPIFNIQGYVLTLLEGGLEDERVNRDFLERASNGVDRLMKIVEDLDLITKLESGVMELRSAPMDLGVAVKEAIDALEMHARQKGMTLRNGIPPGTMVQADRNRILQVLSNLLNNAINYGRAGGHCTVSSYALGNQVAVEVADDGIGVSAEHLPRLFERFYRVGKSRARNEGGSGLGLAIVKHIIEAHGQTIVVKSEEGKGTAFTFTLQLAR